MGNCQAADASTVVIQHPKGGRVERLYWPVSASEVMRNNPGHYVALVTFCQTGDDQTREGNGGVRFTRVKLLRPKDILILGQVYRLVTAQEVMKGLWAKKYERERTRKNQLESNKRQERPREEQHSRPAPETMNQGFSGSQTRETTAKTKSIGSKVNLETVASLFAEHI
ncbi:uncharacterized protein [Aristolochia californica]|uniref:uncharacterized protein isoform X2 n=1 Tax=Aristolochia californica TaxID=171875 RepID=UPI0035DAF6C3